MTKEEGAGIVEAILFTMGDSVEISALAKAMETESKEIKKYIVKAPYFPLKIHIFKFLVETNEKKKAPSYGKSTWKDSISLHLIQLQGEHSKLEVSLIIPNELFCSRKHQADVS